MDAVRSPSVTRRVESTWWMAAACPTNDLSRVKNEKKLTGSGLAWGTLFFVCKAQEQFGVYHLAAPAFHE